MSGAVQSKINWRERYLEQEDSRESAMAPEHAVTAEHVRDNILRVFNRRTGQQILGHTVDRHGAAGSLDPVGQGTHGSHRVRAVAPAPDGSIWGSYLGMPGAVIRLDPGDNPPETALIEVYETPWNHPDAAGRGFSPRGMDIDPV